MTCQFAYDDGVYVLGALCPAERAAYEQHLADCPSCREAVAAIAVLPGLLRRLSSVEAAEPLADTPERVPKLIEQVTRMRRLRKRGLVAAVGLAACLTLLAGIVLVTVRGAPVMKTPPPTAPAMISMTAVDPDTHVTAEVALVEVASGLEVTMHCNYPPYGGKMIRPYTFRLIALGADGVSEQIGSWTAAPGDAVTITGATRFRRSELVRLELRARDGTPLLAYDLP